ncbi:larval cuticle protein LCP-30 [Ceratitis capitata]|uniref:larval cuticle protein LCP-30 n=1 Tax=Ceratitis capitata TaxID=7213 RepID=UPI0006188472|nr:larval cuticle protein LCP-30 [Ceratitis capitata]
MKLICFLVIATLAVNAQALNDKYFGGKYNAPSKITKKATSTRQQPTKAYALKASATQRRTSVYKQPHSTNSGAAAVVGVKVPILRNEQEMRHDGTYHYQYETGNGIVGMEQGTAGVAVKGASSYVSPEGVEIKLTYTADETGYHPVGDHIPKTPDYVLRALEYIRTHPFKVVKAAERRPRLLTEIAPPLYTPINKRNLNYKTSSGFGKNPVGVTSKRQNQRNSRRNELRRRV